MSALESPPTLGSAWQDPWCTGSPTGPIMDPHANQFGLQHPHGPHYDFYNTGKYPYNPHNPHGDQGIYQGTGYPMGPQLGPEQASSGSPSSGSSSENNNLVKEKKPRVNFKLEIKPEPQVSSQGDDACVPVSSEARKVPSISDMSDQESCSLDLPVTQVRPILKSH